LLLNHLFKLIRKSYYLLILLSICNHIKHIVKNVANHRYLLTLVWCIPTSIKLVKKYVVVYRLRAIVLLRVTASLHSIHKTVHVSLHLLFSLSCLLCLKLHQSHLLILKLLSNIILAVVISSSTAMDLLHL